MIKVKNLITNFVNLEQKFRQMKIALKTKNKVLSKMNLTIIKVMNTLKILYCYTNN